VNTAPVTRTARRAQRRLLRPRWRDAFAFEITRHYTVPAPWLMMAAVVLVGAGSAALAVLLAQALADAAHGGLHVDAASLFRAAPTSGASAMFVVAGVLGVYVSSSDRSTGGSHLTNLAVPSARRLLAARLGAVGAVTSGVALATFLVCVIVVGGLAALLDHRPPSFTVEITRGAHLTLGAVAVSWIGTAIGVLLPSGPLAYGTFLAIGWLAPTALRAVRAPAAIIDLLPVDRAATLAGADGASTPITYIVPFAWAAVLCGLAWLMASVSTRRQP